MDNKLNRKKFIGFATIITSYFYGSSIVKSEELNITYTIKDVYKSIEDLKKEVLSVTNWWSVSYRNHIFAVCLQVLPSYGQSKQNIHVWRKGSNGSFAIVWSYRTLGIGSVEVKIEEDKGNISIISKDYSDIKDMVIGFIHLRAAIG